MCVILCYDSLLYLLDLCWLCFIILLALIDLDAGDIRHKDARKSTSKLLEDTLKRSSLRICASSQRKLMNINDMQPMEGIDGKDRSEVSTKGFARDEGLEGTGWIGQMKALKLWITQCEEMTWPFASTEMITSELYTVEMKWHQLNETNEHVKWMELACKKWTRRTELYKLVE